MTKKLLVIDANILSHALTANKTAAFAALFKELEAQYRFIVTGYTQFELTCSSDKEHREKIIEYIQTDMAYVNLTSVLMDFSARLCYLYTHHTSTKGQKIGAGDIINAACCIAKDCPVLTIDSNDYPRPFFRDISRHRITFTSTKNRETVETAYILAPDCENVRACFSELKI